MAKSRGRKFAEITTPTNGVFDIASVPTITNAKLQNSAMTLAGSSVSLGGTGVADTDALSEGSSNLYFTNARVQSFLGGGTLAGNVVVPDNRSIYVGSSSDFRIVHNTTNTQLVNATGALQITSSGGVTVTGATTFSADLTVDTDTLKVDSTNNRVGIGVASPAAPLDVMTTGAAQVYIRNTDNSAQNNAIVSLRTGGYSNIALDGATVDLKIGGSSKVNIDASGNTTVTGSLTASGVVTGTQFSATTTSTTAAVLKLVDSGVASYDVSFPDASTFLLGVNDQGGTTSDKTFKLSNAGSGSFNLDVEGNITAAGNVGIGTASPAQKLEVVSSGFAYVRTRSTASGFTGFDIGQHTGGNIYLNNRDNTSIILQTNNSPRMYLTNSGDVGIGISPTKKLTVFGTGAGNATVQIEGEGGADPYINFLANNTQHWSLGVDDSDSDKFKISEHSALGTNDYFTVDTTGNVGIGTASPTHRLEVRYDVAASTDLDPSSVRLYNNSDGGAAILFENGVSAESKISFGVEGTGAYTDETFLGFNTGANGSMSEHMRIDSAGNVGIDNSNPVSKLHLHGTSGQTNYNSHTNIDEYLATFQTSYNGAGDQNINIVNHNGNWVDGTTGSDTAYGLVWGYGNSIRAGIHYDHRSTEKFDFYSSYAPIRFRVRNAQGNTSPIGSESTMPVVMEIKQNAIGLDNPSALRTDTTFTAATGHATKRWGFGAGRTATSAPFYTINENNAGVYVGYGNTSWTAHSDERIKENITSVGTVLPSLMNMQCVKYNLKTDPGNTKIGFIAQDWESAFPEVVDENSEMVLESDGSIGMAHSSESTTIVKGLSYTETIPLLLKAIQEQQALIEALQTEVKVLKGE